MLLPGHCVEFFVCSMSGNTKMMRLYPLKGYNAFGRVFEEGRRFANGSITTLVVFRKPDSTEHGTALHYGVTAKRRTRPAVLRNRIKRLLRESLRHVVQEYSEAGEELPIQELVLVWNAIPRKSSLLRLRTVLPAVRDTVDKAVRRYRKEHGDDNPL